MGVLYVPDTAPHAKHDYIFHYFKNNPANKKTTEPKRPLNNSSVILGMGYGDHHLGPEVKTNIKHFHKGSEEVQIMGIVSDCFNNFQK